MASQNRQYLYERFGEYNRFYFSKFPYINYENEKIRNFFKRFDFTKIAKDKGSVFTKWIVRDEDTPEIIAHKLYESTHYYWIVLMINKIINPDFDFPLPEQTLYEYIDKKYGVENRYKVHHYESLEDSAPGSLPKGIIVDETYPYAKKEVTNMEHEIKENDKKRHIVLLNPEYLDTVLDELEKVLSSNFRPF